MKLFCGIGLLACLIFGQASAQTASPEQQDLDRALAAAGSSAGEYLRAIEKHLEKYPDSPRRAELERAAARAAIDAHDSRAIILFGGRALARKPDDLSLLEAVIPALLDAASPDALEQALKYARRCQEMIEEMRRDRPHDAAWQDETDGAAARSLCWQARATGALGKPEEALALAGRAFDLYPSAESAREMARWQERLGKADEAVRSLAEAFMIPDLHAADPTHAAQRAADRAHMGELYRKLHGSEAGLGAIVLEAYDRSAALLAARRSRLRAADPNAQLTDPMQFTLEAVGGDTLAMASLRGKVVVLDFWATWCGPCREEHPLLEAVKKEFQGNPRVVFISVNADDDRSAVKPFLDETGWSGPAYFEGGLSRALQVNALPATIVIGKDGRVFSRMSGFDPERFARELSARIREVLAEKGQVRLHIPHELSYIGEDGFTASARSSVG